MEIVDGSRSLLFCARQGTLGAFTHIYRVRDRACCQPLKALKGKNFAILICHWTACPPLADAIGIYFAAVLPPPLLTSLGLPPLRTRRASNHQLLRTDEIDTSGRRCVRRDALGNFIAYVRTPRRTPAYQPGPGNHRRRDTIQDEVVHQILIFSST